MRLKLRSSLAGAEDFWSAAYVLEADGDQWVLAAIAPPGFSPCHLKVRVGDADVKLLLATGSRGQLHPCAEDADPMPPYRMVFRAYVDYIEGDAEQE